MIPNVLNADQGRDIIRVFLFLSCRHGLVIILCIFIISKESHRLLLHDAFVVAIE